MTQKSLEFARQAYCIINNRIATGIKGSIAIATEEHFDKPDPDNMEPALQAVYLHIALLEVLRYRFGEDHINKIQLGVELSESALRFVTTSIEDASGEVPDRLKGYPMVYAVQHAMKLGIDVHAIDTYADYNGERIGPSADIRELTIQQNIHQIGIENPDGFSVIIRGANHLSNDQGISNNKILESGGNIKANPEQNPFKSTYRHVYYFNAAHPNTEQLSGDSLDEKIIAAESHFYTGTNAVQIHAAAVVPNLTLANIVKDVEEAARLVELTASKDKASSLTTNPLHCAISGLALADQQFILERVHDAWSQHACSQNINEISPTFHPSSLTP